MVKQVHNRIDKSILRICGAMLGAGALLIAAAAQAQEGGDLQAQILYAFHTEDLNQARELTRNLAAAAQDQGANAAVHYHWAHAEYRYAGLVAAAQPGEASKALEVCIKQLSELIAADKDAAEPLILQAACYADLAQIGGLGKILARRKAHDRIDGALKIAPRNPRAQLVLGIQQMRDDPGSLTVPEGIRQAAEIFEQAPATADDTPGWGHADAYLLMGHELRLHGEVLAARNWIEQALIAAPDYRAAQRELAELIAATPAKK